MICFLATRWGAQLGGINAFNAAFCKSLPAEVRAVTLCVVEEASQADVENAHKSGVELFVLARRVDDQSSTLSLIAELLGRRFETVDYWIGHDVWTGPAALALAKKNGGRSSVIHHMDFGAYAQFKHPDEKAEEKAEEQGRVLQAADVPLAIGPVLRASATRHCGRPVAQLSPGLPDIRSTDAEMSVGHFDVLIIGRISAEDDPIKQVQLCLAAVAKAATTKNSHHEWRVKVIGVDQAISDSYRDVLKALQAQSEIYVNLRLLPYGPQDELLGRISGADLVLMPSLREGFGLVAWEAIGAGVPVIVSRSSGVYRHLSELSLDPMVESLQLRGRRASQGIADEADVENLSGLIANIYMHRLTYKKRALELRRILKLRTEATWKHCVQQFLEALGLKVQKRHGRALPVYDAKMSGRPDFRALAFLVRSPGWVEPGFRGLLNQFNLRSVDDRSRATEVLHRSISTTLTVEQLGIIHQALCGLGYSPNRDEFFKRAGRPIISPMKTGVLMVSIRGGLFTPGTPLTEPDRDGDEGPGEEVTVPDFRLSQTVITNRQFSLFAPERRIYSWTGLSDRDVLDHPVVCVSWWEAYIYCIWAGGRLPTEVEWEYACRAGSETAYYSGHTLGFPAINSLVNYADRRAVHNRTLPADAETVPHPFGLRHMHGNVWEWCWDVYKDTSHGRAWPDFDAFAETSAERVARGGSWDVPAHACRSGFRNRQFPNYRNNDLGIRLAMPE